MNRAAVSVGIVSVLGLAVAPAEACADHSMHIVATLPGGGIWGAWALPVIILLNGFLERPFVTWAGVQEHALRHSIQGSVVAGLVVHAIGTFAWPAALPLSPLILIGLPLLHWHIKRSYLSPDLHGGRLLVGTIVSLLAVALLPILLEVFGTTRGSHVIWARRVAPTAGFFAFVGVAAWCVWAFMIDRRPRRVIDDPRRGFEVLPPSTMRPIA